MGGRSAPPQDTGQPGDVRQFPPDPGQGSAGNGGNRTGTQTLRERCNLLAGSPGGGPVAMRARQATKACAHGRRTVLSAMERQFPDPTLPELSLLFIQQGSCKKPSQRVFPDDLPSDRPGAFSSRFCPDAGLTPGKSMPVQRIERANLNTGVLPACSRPVLPFVRDRGRT